MQFLPRVQSEKVHSLLHQALMEEGTTQIPSVLQSRDEKIAQVALPLLKSGGEYYDLATLYERGGGVSKDLSMALRLYWKAFEVDYPASQRMFLQCAIQKNDADFLYQLAKESEQTARIDKVFWLLGEAFKMGSCEATETLCEWYLCGHFVEKDLNVALYFLKKRLKLGGPDFINIIIDQVRTLHISEILYRLALSFEQGTGLDQDVEMAFRLYAKVFEFGYGDAFQKLVECSATLQNPHILYELAMRYREDTSLEIQPREIFRLFEKAAQAGDPFAICEIGSLSEAVGDYDGALVMYEEASKRNHVEGSRRAVECALKFSDPGKLFEFGMKYERSRDQDAYNNAIRFYERAAELGYLEAKRKVATWFYEGLFVSKNFHKAMRFYEEFFDYGESWALEPLVRCAVELNQCERMYDLAVQHEEGINRVVNTKKAFLLYRELARQGVPRAAYRLGTSYEKGIETEENGEQAFLFYEMAASANIPEALFKMGRCYERGYGRCRDMSLAAKFYKSASDLEDLDATCSLGELYEEGKGVGKSLDKAFALYQKAAKNDHPQALFKLGLCYEKGRGVDRNFRKAAELYEKASERGFPQALCKLGFCYIIGNLVPQNLSSAYSFIKQAHFFAEKAWNQTRRAAMHIKEPAAYNYFEALAHLGMCYLFGLGTEKNIEEGLSLVQRACIYGHPFSFFVRGLSYIQGSGVPQNLEESVKSFRKAAEGGFGLAEMQYAQILMEGQDIDRGRLWYNRAIDQEVSEAMVAMAKLHIAGDRVPKDHSNAKRLLLLAAGLGDSTAQNELCRMKLIP